MPLSEELKELYASGGSDVLLPTLSFNHVSWDSQYHIVRDWQDLTANLENSGPEVTFQKYAFNIKGPNKNETGNQSLVITIDAVNQSLIDLLTQANADTNNAPIEVVYRLYLSSDTSGPQNDPPLKLWMRKANITNTRITGQAELIGLENRSFPNVKYSNVFQSLVHSL